MSLVHCPCCSGILYSECCQPLHQGGKQATSPEQLMRSRYAAFAKVEVDYLLKTSHVSIRSGFTKQAIRQWATENDWEKLEVIRSSETGDLGLVEFKAYYHSPKEKKEVHHELSEFIKEKGEWFYSKGIIKPSIDYSIKRNDPCPCGSGKKHKKCCG